ncbi:MAG: ABC transporter permease subunit [Armatimonadota bacterium]
MSLAALPRRRSLSDRAIANLFLLPTIFLLVAMNVFPLFWSLYLSFTKYKADRPKVAPEWVANGNFLDLMQNEAVWQSFRVTASFTLLSVLLQLMVGLGLAILLNRAFKLKGIVTTLFLMPMMFSSVVVGLFWRFMFDPSYGLINFLLSKVGLNNPRNPINWFDKDHALWTVVIADTWQWAPFVMLIALAGLSSVPKTLYEAASVDRASEWFRFRFITLPFIAPLLMVALLFRTLDCFKMFDTAFVMTNGGVANSANTISIEVFRRALEQYNIGSACALAYIVLLVIIGMTNLYLMLMAKIRGEDSPDAKPLLQGIAESGFGRHLTKVLPWTTGVLLVWGIHSAGGPLLLVAFAVLAGWCALLFALNRQVRHLLACVGIVIALVIYLTPLWWIVATSFKPYQVANSDVPVLFFKPTFDNFRLRADSASDAAFPGQLLGSLFVGVVSTALSVLMGTLSAYAFSRFRIKARNDALFFILSTRMLPAVVVVVPVFLMYQALGLLDTYLGLILLYTTVGVAFATWLMKGFTDDVPKEYEEAAMLDRYTRFAAIRKCVLPLILPGMAATAVFVFLNSWNEYAFAQLLKIQASSLTAPPSITAALGKGSIEWNLIAARAVVFVLLPTIFTFLMRNHLLRGMTFGAIKGR